MSTRNGQKSAGEILLSSTKQTWTAAELASLVSRMKPAVRAKLGRALARLEAEGLIDPASAMAGAIKTQQRSSGAV